MILTESQQTITVQLIERRSIHTSGQLVRLLEAVGELVHDLNHALQILIDVLHV